VKKQQKTEKTAKISALPSAGTRQSWALRGCGSQLCRVPATSHSAKKYSKKYIIILCREPACKTLGKDFFQINNK